MALNAVWRFEVQARLRKDNNPQVLRTAEILDIILRDEIGHVAVGNRWCGLLCMQRQLDHVAQNRALAHRHNAPRLRPPFNEVTRRQAGLGDVEIAALFQMAQAPSQQPPKKPKGGLKENRIKLQILSIKTV